MPIKLTGTGTITGITSGGLPDGSITNADIADLAASKLTGALPAISGAALTNLPSGITKSGSNPTGTTNPSGGVGTIFLNTATGEMYSCTDATTNANVWTNVGDGTGPEPYTLPTGGTVTTDGDYKVHTFNTNATFTVNSGAFTGGFDYLVIAGGGGGGGGYHGGGGGAGGYLTGTLASLSSATYSVIVGGGGSAGSAGGTDTGTQGGDGTNSVFASITATGGGGGGSFAVPNGRNGGSGGGAGMSNTAGNAGSGTSGQGNNGGSRGSYSSPYSGAGGGGAGAVGTNGGATSTAHGGVGLSSSITGSAVFRAGGGGGGNRTGDTNGGNGGGGGGGYTNTPSAGTANTGGGGGAGGNDTNNGASGGSGVVIIRYQFQQGKVMSHFAEIDKDGKVLRVLVSEQDFINSGAVGDSFNWVQTSYNHNFRKQYAGIGYTYDKTKDKFIAPQRFPSWVLDDNDDWQPPTAMPDDGKRYAWDEENKDWKEQ